MFLILLEQHFGIGSCQNAKTLSTVVLLLYQFLNQNHSCLLHIIIYFYPFNFLVRCLFILDVLIVSRTRCPWFPVNGHIIQYIIETSIFFQPCWLIGLTLITHTMHLRVTFSFYIHKYNKHGGQDRWPVEVNIKAAFILSLSFDSFLTFSS